MSRKDRSNHEDYYHILGVGRDADFADIRKAYKKLALKWHPDRHSSSTSAADKFKKISEAYEVLSNTEKRRLYDMYGHSAFGQEDSGRRHSHASFHDPMEIFREFFGNRNPFSGFFGGDAHLRGSVRDSFFDDAFSDFQMGPGQFGSGMFHGPSSGGFISQQVQTCIVNGKKTTVIKTTSEDGTVTEKTIDSDGSERTRKFIPGGMSSHHASGRLR